MQSNKCLIIDQNNLGNVPNDTLQTTHSKHPHPKGDKNFRKLKYWISG
jgi:hypothetical protein